MKRKLGKAKMRKAFSNDPRGFCGCACTCSKVSTYFTEGCETWVNIALIEPSYPQP